MVQKQRVPVPAQIKAEMYEMRRKGLTAAQVAARFDCCESTVYRIWRKAGLTEGRKLGKRKRKVARNGISSRDEAVALLPKAPKKHIDLPDREMDILEGLSAENEMTQREVLSLLLRREEKQRWLKDYREMIEGLL